MNFSFLSNTFRLLILSFAATVALPTSAFSDSTIVMPWKLTAAAASNFSIHSPNFTGLPGVQSCCTGFTEGFGASPAFFLGAEYIPKSLLLGMRYNPGISIGYSSIAGNLEKEAFLANIIRGNSFEKGFVLHSLSTQHSYIEIKPYASIFPFADIPLGLTIGLSAGISAAASFDQRETLAAPDGTFFRETGTKNRNEASGTIQGVSPLILGAVVAVRYDIPLKERWTLIPSIAYLPYFSNLNNEIPWNVSLLRGEFTVAYQLHRNIAEPIVLPPPPPPPAALTFAIQSSVNNRKVLNGEKIEISELTTEKRLYTFAAPILFYTKNSSDITTISTPNPNTLSSAQQMVLDGVVQAMVQNPKSILSIETGYEADEDSSMAALRYSKVLSTLQQRGVAGNRIQKIQNSPSTAKFRRTELLEEMRYAKFYLDGKLRTIPIVTVEIQKEPIAAVQYKATPILYAEAKPAIIAGKVVVNSTTISEFSESAVEGNLSKYFDGDNAAISLTISAIAIDNEKKSIADTVNIFVVKKERRTIENKYAVNQLSEQTEDIVLGYFSFDQSTFSSVNDIAVQKCKDALAAGKKISLLALTDALGTPDHNRVLAKQRAATALELLEITESDAEIVYGQNIFGNDTPENRTLQRSVIARIEL